MNRIKIYMIRVTMVQEKLLVEFPLPENAIEIYGLAVSADTPLQAYRANIIQGNLATGNISLAIPESGDVFFNELVKPNLNTGSWENMLIPQIFPLEQRQFENSIGFCPYDVHLKGTTFFTAFYEDFVNKPGSPAVSYNVRIYLYYTV